MSTGYFKLGNLDRADLSKSDYETKTMPGAPGGTANKLKPSLVWVRTQQTAGKRGTNANTTHLT